MIEILLFLIVGVFVAGITAGCLIGGWRVMFDSSSELLWRAFGAMFFLIGLFICVLTVGVVTGQVSLQESVPDGCYRVLNDLKAMPAGKSMILYNDRHYLPIQCP